MALCTCNGFDLVEAKISLPRVGIWSALIVVEKPEAITGSVELKLGAMTLTGAVRTGGLYLLANHLFVVGGKGGLGKVARPKFYRAGTVKMVLDDLLRDAGESLDSASDAAVLATKLPAWTTIATETGKAVRTLLGMAAAGSVWRCASGGGIWVGPESWPASSSEFDILQEQPDEGHFDAGMDAPCLLPGQTLPDGRRIDRVEYVITPSSTRAKVWQ